MRGVLVFGAIAVASLAASPLHLPLNNPNEGVRVFAAKALVEHGTFAIDEAVRQWGYIDDKATSGGRLYSSKAPLMSLLGAGAYALVHPFRGDLGRVALTRLCRFAGDALPTLVVAWLFWRALRRRVDDPAVADLVTVGAVLGSGTLASMHVFSGHALAALAPATALLLVTEREARAWHRPVAGFLLAAAVGAEYPALAASAPIALAGVVVARGRRARAFVALAAGAAPVIIAVSVAHTLMFGAPWRTGYSFLENQDYRDVVAGTLFGIGAPRGDVLATVLFSAEVGLFFYSPFLLVGVVWLLWALAGLGRGDARAGRRWAVPAAAAVALTLLFIAGFRGWRGGWSVGPRYISELIGLLAVPTALACDALSARSPRLARALLAPLVAAGLVHSGVAGLFFPHLSDVYRNPVHEMMLPVVARGASPDSIFLWLGLPREASAALLVALLALALLMALGRAPGARSAWVTSLAAVVGLVFVGPRFARTEPARAAAETRRLLHTWRPEEGVPKEDRAPPAGARAPRG